MHVYLTSQIQKVISSPYSIIQEEIKHPYRASINVLALY